MGMLLRRHRKGIDAARQATPVPGAESLPTPPITAGDTGVPPVDSGNPTVPTGEVPAGPVDPPQGDDAIAEGTPGGDENVEDKVGAHEGQTVPEVKDEASEANDAPSVADAPTRNASKAVWLEFLGLDEDPRSRDELAESVLGPKS